MKIVQFKEMTFKCHGDKGWRQEGSDKGLPDWCSGVERMYLDELWERGNTINSLEIALREVQKFNDCITGDGAIVTAKWIEWVDFDAALRSVLISEEVKDESSNTV